MNLELPNLADTLKFDGLSSSFKDVLDLYEENVLCIFMDVEWKILVLVCKSFTSIRILQNTEYQ